MKERSFDEMIAYFNRRVSEMDIAQDYKMELLGMVTALGYKHEQTAQQWIPCKVRLPQKDGKYSVTVRSNMGNWNYTTELWYGKPTLPMNGTGGKRGWFESTSDGDYWIDDVLAWRELPEPWKGEQP